MDHNIDIITLDPDPNWATILDPASDPNSIYLDPLPVHWQRQIGFQLLFLISFVRLFINQYNFYGSGTGIDFSFDE